MNYESQVNPIINTVPIEDFIDRVKIAKSTGQKQVTLDIKQAEALANSMTLTMVRLAGLLDLVLRDVTVGKPAEFDGGTF